MNQQDASLLSAIYKASKMGMQVTKTILDKSNESELKNDIMNQYETYSKTARRAGQELIHQGIVPEDNGLLSKAALWGSIQLNTLGSTNLSQISEMMINGSTMSIVDLTKKLHDSTDITKDVNHFAKSYIKNEEKNIETLKKYL